MDRETAKQLLPIMQAFVEGKPVQHRIVGTSQWYDVGDDIYIGQPEFFYRIKPEPSYRPFTLAEAVDHLEKGTTFVRKSDITQFKLRKIEVTRIAGTGKHTITFSLCKFKDGLVQEGVYLRATAPILLDAFSICNESASTLSYLSTPAGVEFDPNDDVAGIK